MVLNFETYGKEAFFEISFQIFLSSLFFIIGYLGLFKPKNFIVSLIFIFDFTLVFYLIISTQKVVDLIENIKSMGFERRYAYAIKIWGVFSICLSILLFNSFFIKMSHGVSLDSKEIWLHNMLGYQNTSSIEIASISAILVEQSHKGLDSKLIIHGKNGTQLETVFSSRYRVKNIQRDLVKKLVEMNIRVRTE
jgi:hypothetical protein